MSVNLSNVLHERRLAEFILIRGKHFLKIIFKTYFNLQSCLADGIFSPPTQSLAFSPYEAKKSISFENEYKVLKICLQMKIVITFT